MDDTLVLGAWRGRTQKRGGRKSDWTRAMADAFAETLADTCNVTLAAQAIGRSISNVYKHRDRDASFRASWDRALATGYSRLELMLLERALHGVEKVVTARDGTTSIMREYPDRVALTLLRMHRDNPAISSESAGDEEYEQACERIIGKLERLRERDLGDKGEVQTKGATGRHELIRWGLRR